jgi:hypothetical protein
MLERKPHHQRLGARSKDQKTRQLEPGASPLIVRMIGTGRIRPTRRFKIKATVERNYSGAGRFVPARNVGRREETPDAGHRPTPSGVLDYIGLSVPNAALSKREHFEIRVFHRAERP